jgi:hypothetical protein
MECDGTRTRRKREYREFEKALTEAITNAEAVFKGVVYDAESICSFFDAYEVMVNYPEEPCAPRLGAALKEEMRLRQVCNGGNDTSICCVPSTELPAQVIVVGDVVYNITSYGMPLYDNANDCFQPGERSLLHLVVYRREDVGEAEKARGHLEKFMQLAKCDPLDKSNCVAECETASREKPDEAAEATQIALREASFCDNAGSRPQ